MRKRYPLGLVLFLDRYAQSLLAERAFSFRGIEDGPTLVVLDGEVGAMLDKEPGSPAVLITGFACAISNCGCLLFSDTCTFRFVSGESITVFSNKSQEYISASTQK